MKNSILNLFSHSLVLLLLTPNHTKSQITSIFASETIFLSFLLRLRSLLFLIVWQLILSSEPSLDIFLVALTDPAKTIELIFAHFENKRSKRLYKAT